MSKSKFFSLIILNLFIRSSIASEAAPVPSVPAKRDISKELLDLFGNEEILKPLVRAGLEGTPELRPMASDEQASLPIASVIVIAKAFRDERKPDGTLANTRGYTHYTSGPVRFEEVGKSPLLKEAEDRLKLLADTALIPKLCQALKTQIDVVDDAVDQYESDDVVALLIEKAKSALRKTRRELGAMDLGSDSDSE